MPRIGGKLAPNASQLSAISRLFSSAVFREMAGNGRSSAFVRLLNISGIRGSLSSCATVGDAFESAFAVLKTVGRRDEYIYRAAVTQKVLMGKHSLKTACMLSEFRAGASKADLVILNGTATVFEIKSERDSLVRLANQVANYKKVFASVNVIASEAHVRGVMAAVPEDVGVLCLSGRYQISPVREAEDRPDSICPFAVFKSVRTAEASAILKLLGHFVPEVPNTMLHKVIGKMFVDLRPEDVHLAMVRTLRQTRNLSPLSELVDKLPTSLHAAALSIQIRKSEREGLIDAVSTQLIDAMAWA